VRKYGNHSPVRSQRLKATTFPAEVECVTIAGKTRELSEQVIGEGCFAAGGEAAGEATVVVEYQGLLASEIKFSYQRTSWCFDKSK